MLTEAKLPRAIEMGRSGMSYKAISRALGSCSKDVSDSLKAHGIVRVSNKVVGRKVVENCCTHCGKQFEDARRRRFCSRTCNDQSRIVWTKERILEVIRSLGSEGGVVSTKGQGTLVTVARRMFGSWVAACQQAGMVTASRAVPRCAQCSAAINHEGLGRRRYCSVVCADRAKFARYNRYWKQRLKVYALGERIEASVVFARSCWMCQLCGSAIDPALQHPHPMCGTIDHIVPLSSGGEHVLTNVQAAHLTCNSSKGGAHRGAAATLPCPAEGRGVQIPSEGVFASARPDLSTHPQVTANPFGRPAAGSPCD